MVDAYLEETHFDGAWSKLGKVVCNGGVEVPVAIELPKVRFELGGSRRQVKKKREMYSSDS